MSNPGQIVGPAGPAGPAGAAGAAGTAGRGFTPRGAWAAATVYATDDLVQNAGHTYRAKNATGPIVAGNAAPTGVASGNAFGAALSVTIPATALVGDLILIATSTVSNQANGTPATPAGFALLQTSDTGLERLMLFSKTAVAGDVGAVITFAAPGNSSQVICRTYTAAGLDVSAIGTTGTPTAVVTTVANDLAVSFFGVLHGSFAVAAGTFTAGSTATQVVNTAGGGNNDLAAEDIACGAAGANPPAGGVYNPNNAGSTIAGITAALKPQAAAVFPAASWEQWV